MNKKCKAYSGLILLLIISLLLSACATSQKEELIFYGTAEATQIDVSAEIGGKIKQINVQEGQHIKSGDLLAVIDTPENSIKSEQSQIAVQTAQNESAKPMADKSNILSMTEGTVQSINYEAGEYAALGSPVVTLIDRKDMWVKIYVPESILPLIKVDQQVDIKCDFIKDKTIKGEITAIADEAEFTPMNVVTKKDRMKLVFEVKIKLTQGYEDIKPGMLLDVDLSGK